MQATAMQGRLFAAARRVFLDTLGETIRERDRHELFHRRYYEGEALRCISAGRSNYAVTKRKGAPCVRLLGQLQNYVLFH